MSMDGGMRCMPSASTCVLQLPHSMSGQCSLSGTNGTPATHLLWRKLQRSYGIADVAAHVLQPTPHQHTQLFGVKCEVGQPGQPTQA